MARRPNLVRHPPQELLRDRFIYDLESGVFIWRIQPCLWIKAGDIAGCKSQAYWKIGVKGFGQIGAHRLAWIYMYGPIPDGLEIDHKDNNPLNNRLSNLRLATSQEQKMNKRTQSNNRVHLKGAYYHNRNEGKDHRKVYKNWRSQIKAPDGRLIFLGYFYTPQEAHAAYAEAAVKYYGEFSRSA